MVTRPAVQDFQVHVGARGRRETFEEVLHQFRLQVADARDLELQVYDGERPARQVDGGDGQRFIHRHHEVAGAVDPALRADGFRDRRTEREAGIFDGVMLVDVEISGRLQFQVEPAVAREQLQHVIEKSHAGGDAIPAASFDREPDFHARFGRSAINDCASHPMPPWRPGTPWCLPPDPL